LFTLSVIHMITDMYRLLYSQSCSFVVQDFSPNVTYRRFIFSFVTRQLPQNRTGTAYYISGASDFTLVRVVQYVLFYI